MQAYPFDYLLKVLLLLGSQRTEFLLAELWQGFDVDGELLIGELVRNLFASLPEEYVKHRGNYKYTSDKSLIIGPQVRR